MAERSEATARNVSTRFKSGPTHSPSAGASLGTAPTQHSFRSKSDSSGVVPERFETAVDFEVQKGGKWCPSCMPGNGDLAAAAVSGWQRKWDGGVGGVALLPQGVSDTRRLPDESGK